jgi:hypothetical protein
MVTYNVAAGYHLLAVSIVLLILAFYFYSDTLDQEPEHHQNKKPVFSLPDKHLMKFAIICFGCMACENTMYDWSVIYFQKACSCRKIRSYCCFCNLYGLYDYWPFCRG